MAWTIQTPLLGAQPITEISTTQQHPLGTVIRAQDPTFGSGEFIYLEGVVNTLTGHGVTYDAATFQTALASVVGGVSTPIAIAMGACVADRYGWYQISGRATAKKASATSFAAAVAFGFTSGLMIAAVTGKRLSNAVTAVATSAGALTSLLVVIQRPAVSTVAEA